MDAMIEQLLSAGHLGLFAVFLIYQHFSLQKRHDKLVDSFQTQLKQINIDYEKRIEKMRERYDAVIREAREEREADAKDFLVARAEIQQKIVAKLDRILERG
ncbi:MAG: hypothetical protein GOVbin1454_22 [Prokaryotic dsDNA virus sp.]|nr:MAG: hypothetical protein GOVbin1454_22 [Prokaryotic dsDNA virus sp.]|tara:strand:- start:9240 stop:9545 length:306 start_codon:yes stop_codon:yes gene_type:complete